MTLAAAFTDLYEHLETLREFLIGLRTTVVEDKPLRGDFVLVDRFGNAADDLRGLLEEALAAAHEGWQAIEEQTDLERARRALTTCQERFNRLTYQFSFDLFSYERLAALNRFGREQGGEWRAWAGVVGNTLHRCQQHVYDVNQALFRCYQEMVESAGTTSVSVRATNIGQQIAVPEGWDLKQDEFT
jgi:hypothetical protein